MTTLYPARLDLLGRSANQHLFHKIKHGIEREGLRVSKKAQLSLAPHPHAFGKALTHPHITTDFSEALLEYITPVYFQVDDTLAFLDELHRYTVQHLHNETLWAASMPCDLTGEENIPVAQYGHSNIGKMKTVYRKGLANRYGAAMQTIAGIHYNFSLPEDFWLLTNRCQSEGCLDLIRNVRRYSWLLMYLFGASPVISKSFLGDEWTNSGLDTLDSETLYLPYATSLRMSDIGYTNRSQSSLNICYNSLAKYVNSLERATQTQCSSYQEIGVKVGGEYQQLNTNLLQIENEYYSSIRPKRVTLSGEKPIAALRTRGVEYIEVRCIDINPFESLGISNSDAYFLDVFLIYCGLEKSNPITEEEGADITENFRKSVVQGRLPELLLNHIDGPTPLSSWGKELLETISPIAELMDYATQSTRYTESLTSQSEKLVNVAKTPSAQLLMKLKKSKLSYTNFVHDLSEKHHDIFQQNPLSPERLSYFTRVAEQSKRDQNIAERTDRVSFDEFLQAYQRTASSGSSSKNMLKEKNV